MYSLIPNDYFIHHVVGRQLKLALIPRRCYITKRRIWLELAYCVTAMYTGPYTGPGTPVYDHRWYNKDEYLIARIKDLI